MGENIALGPPSLSFASILQRVVISPSLAAYAQKYDLQSFTAKAMSEALHLMSAVHVGRAVEISSTAAFHAVSKDFAFDADEARVCRCAHSAVTALAAALVVASSQDILRADLTKNLRKYMDFALNDDPHREAVIEAVVPVLVEDNMPYAISFLKATTSDKAKHRIDQLLVPKMQARAALRTHGKPFFDLEEFRRSDFAWLPDSLRPRSGAHEPPHSCIYESFLKMSGGANKVGVEDTVEAELHAVDAQFRRWTATLDEQVAANPNFVGPIPTGSAVAASMQEVLGAAGDWNVAESLFARTWLACLWDVSLTRQTHEAYVSSLENLYRKFPVQVNAEVAAYFMGQPDDTLKFRTWLLERMLRTDLLCVNQLDAILAEGLTPRDGWGVTIVAVDCAVTLLQNCLLKDGVIAPTGLPLTCDALGKVAKDCPQFAAPISAVLAADEQTQAGYKHPSTVSFLMWLDKRRHISKSPDFASMGVDASDIIKLNKPLHSSSDWLMHANTKGPHSSMATKTPTRFKEVCGLFSHFKSI
eukprot:jgi/Botrbrau1/18477/Bobra.0072s0059.1